MRYFLLFLAAFAVAFTGCRRDVDKSSRTLGFDTFVPQYNRYIREWLKKEHAAIVKEKGELDGKISHAGTEEEKVAINKKLADVQVKLETNEFRQGLGDYFSFKDINSLPKDLVWQNGQEEPEIGDPRAQKGGVFRKFIDTFPPTIRSFGPNSNNSFRGDLYDLIEMSLVTLHPHTNKIIPGLAKEWAESADKRTVFFRIDPEARYSNGEKVRAKDFMVAVYVRVSDYIAEPFHKQYYREQYAQIAVYDDETLGITLPQKKMMLPFFAGGISPSCPSFYNEYGPDFAERYQWLFPPTTGAYEVREGDIVKGVSITQTRVKDWWAKDKKYCRYLYNPDKIVHTVVRERSKAFELFRAGQLEAFVLGEPDFWYEKTEMEPVYHGYIEKVKFYNQWPRLPRGLYFNLKQGLLGDKNVRVGAQYAMNWQKVIEVVFRGDSARLPQFTSGFGPYQNPAIKARPYSITNAREAFKAAGFTEEGADGILRKPDGTRLRIAVNYASLPLYDRIMAILREEAKRAGLDLALDGQEATVAYKKSTQKLHESVFTAWYVQPPFPRYYEYLHSSNAFDDKGNMRPDTNNVFSWAREDTDRLCEQERNAQTQEEFIDACWKIQQIMHDEALFCPGFQTPFSRIGFWRWVKWPDSDTTKFCPPINFDPMESFVFWIDQDVQKETLKAMTEGKTFPEKTTVYEQFRDGIPQDGTPIKAPEEVKDNE